MRPFIFFTCLVGAAASGYGIWTVLGDSWLLSSIAGTFFGWIGCMIANLGPRVPITVVSSGHSARFDKLHKGR